MSLRRYRYGWRKKASESKFSAPQDPLKFEAGLGQIKAPVSYVENEFLKDSSTAGVHAYGNWKQDLTESQAHLKFGSDFRDWLVKKVAKEGKTWNERPSNGQAFASKRPLVTLPGVSSYLDSFGKAQMDFKKKYEPLRAYGPRDLNEAYLYWKYVQTPINLHDEKEKQNFLNDYNLHIIQAQANEDDAPKSFTIVPDDAEDVANEDWPYRRSGEGRKDFPVKPVVSEPKGLTTQTKLEALQKLLEQKQQERDAAQKRLDEIRRKKKEPTDDPGEPMTISPADPSQGAIITTPQPKGKEPADDPGEPMTISPVDPSQGAITAPPIDDPDEPMDITPTTPAITLPPPSDPVVTPEPKQILPPPTTPVITLPPPSDPVAPIQKEPPIIPDPVTVSVDITKAQRAAAAAQQQRGRRRVRDDPATSTALVPVGPSTISQEEMAQRRIMLSKTAREVLDKIQFEHIQKVQQMEDRRKRELAFLEERTKSMAVVPYEKSQQELALYKQQVARLQDAQQKQKEEMDAHVTAIVEQNTNRIRELANQAVAEEKEKLTELAKAELRKEMDRMKSNFDSAYDEMAKQFNERSLQLEADRAATQDQINEWVKQIDTKNKTLAIESQSIQEKRLAQEQSEEESKAQLAALASRLSEEKLAIEAAMNERIMSIEAGAQTLALESARINEEKARLNQQVVFVEKTAGQLDVTYNDVVSDLKAKEAQLNEQAERIRQQEQEAIQFKQWQEYVQRELYFKEQMLRMQMNSPGVLPASVIMQQGVPLALPSTGEENLLRIADREWSEFNRLPIPDDVANQNDDEILLDEMREQQTILALPPPADWENIARSPAPPVAREVKSLTQVRGILMNMDEDSGAKIWEDEEALRGILNEMNDVELKRVIKLARHLTKSGANKFKSTDKQFKYYKGVWGFARQIATDKIANK